MTYEFVTPYQIPPTATVSIFGASETGQWLAQMLLSQGNRILAFLDNTLEGKWNDIPILKPEVYAAHHQPDTIIILASHAHDAITADLKRNNLAANYRADRFYDFQRGAALGRMLPDLGYTNGPALRQLTGLTSQWRPKLEKLDMLSVAEQALGSDADISRYVVNLGCFDGKTGDPCYSLFAAGYAGVVVDAIDIDDPRVRDIVCHLPYDKVHKMMGRLISPSNVSSLLEEANCPCTPVMLKIDIDGYDAPVLEEILKSGYRPGILRMEVNADLPPNIRFSVRYHPDYIPDGRFGFYGCSLAAVTHLVRPYGYELVELDFGYPDLPQGIRDVTLIRSDLLQSLGLKAEDDASVYYREPLAFSHFYADLGIDPRKWRHRTDKHELYREVWQACVMASTARHGQIMPFALEVN